jgi:hypothetical protein
MESDEILCQGLNLYLSDDINVPVFLESVHHTEKLTQKLKYRSLHFSKSAL